jgi:hypothetical protein
MKGGYPTKKNHVREILTPENLASEREKITHRPDFFTWMRSTPAACSSLSVQDCGALTGAPAGLGRHPHLYLFYSVIR